MQVIGNHFVIATPAKAGGSNPERLHMGPGLLRRYAPRNDKVVQIIGTMI